MRESSCERDSVPDDSSDCPPASQRLTFDVGAIASIAGLHDTGGNVPLTHCVPERTACEAPADISGDETRVLLHIDGRTSLARISEQIEVPLVEVVAIFLCLMRLGLVEVPWQEPGCVGRPSP